MALASLVVLALDLAGLAGFGVGVVSSLPETERILADAGERVPTPTSLLLAPGAAGWCAILGALALALVVKEAIVRPPRLRVRINVAGAALGMLLHVGYCSAVSYSLCAGPAHTTPGHGDDPPPAILLRQSESFIALDAWNSAALYSTKDGHHVRRFAATDIINKISVSADEKLLLVGCYHGGIGAWEIATGAKLWWKIPSGTRGRHIYDLSVARNAKRFVVSHSGDRALICDTQTGRTIQTIAFPPETTSIMSSALSPDGTKGVLIDLGEGVYTFDVARGTLKDTGLTGAWPIRYSADGGYFAFRSNNSGIREQLRVVAVGRPFAEGKRDVGHFANIGRIRPAADGGFLVTGWALEPDDKGYVTIGCKYSPADGQLKELWRGHAGMEANKLTDFSPERMLGVSAEMGLVTYLVDLRQGRNRFRIDNSARAIPPGVGDPPEETAHLLGGGMIWLHVWPLFLWATAILLGAVAEIVLRDREHHAPPGHCPTRSRGLQ